MAEVQDPRTGIWYGFDLGYSTWKTKMDANLKLLGLMQQFAVIDRNLATPPGSPSDGDAYIVADSATGDWATHEGDIAIYVDADSAWTFLTPVEGWVCWINDEDLLSGWNGTFWTNGIELTRQESIADRDLTAPPATPSDGDAYIPATVATGAWVGHETEIAVWVDIASAWHFITPDIGRIIYVVDETLWAGWNGTAWVAV